MVALCELGTDLAVVCQRSDVERYRKLAPGVDVRPGPFAIAHRPARLAWEQTGLPLMAQNLGADVLHSPFYTMPLRCPIPVVATIHDATWFTEPQLHSAVTAGVIRSAIKAALRRAARVVVPSESTRDELVRSLGAEPETIEVAPHGVDTRTFRPPSPDETRRVSDRLGLHGTP